MWLKVLLFVGLGFLDDCLAALYTRLTCSGRAFAAANISAIITLLTIFVFYRFVVGREVVAIASYVTGIWLGTYLATKINMTTNKSGNTIEENRRVKNG